jgi:4-amino-4-deoxy-L-arabinose transferase-like glycosyltransferase
MYWVRMKVLKALEKNRDFWLVTFITFLFFILRLPSLFEPLWYGDEGIYQTIGTALRHGKILYLQIFDNKPPLLYWIYAILQSDQFLVRLASAIFGLFSVIAFYFLSKKLFTNVKNNYIPAITTFIFAILFGLPALEGNIANAENFMLLPIIASALLIVKQKNFFLAGLLLGIAFLTKIVAVFDLSAFLVFYLILNFNSLKKEIKISKILAGFLFPILLATLYFIVNHAFLDFAKATFVNNVSYVGYGNRIGSLPILLFIKLILLIIFVIYIFVKRKILNKSTLFILIWLAFSLFNAFFSQRPYTHYLLTLIPSLSLAAGLVLFDKKYQKIISVIFLIVLIIIMKGFGTPKFNKNINYYQNFISYMMNKKTTISYQKFFDGNTPFDYRIAQFIKPKLNINDTIFVWGNNAQLYQLTNTVAPTKYIVAYHITNYKDGVMTTIKGLGIAKPKFIVVMTNSGAIPFSLTGYSKIIDINSAIIYEKIF